MKLAILTVFMLLLSACTNTPPELPKAKEVTVKVTNLDSSIDCDRIIDVQRPFCYPYIYPEPTTENEMINSVFATGCSPTGPRVCWPGPGDQLRAVCETRNEDGIWYGVIIKELEGMTEANIPHSYQGKPLGYIFATDVKKQAEVTLRDCRDVVV